MIHIYSAHNNKLLVVSACVHYIDAVECQMNKKNKVFALHLTLLHGKYVTYLHYVTDLLQLFVPLQSRESFVS